MTPEQEAAAWARWNAEVAKIIANQNMPAPAPSYPPGTLIVDLATGVTTVVAKPE